MTCGYPWCSYEINRLETELPPAPFPGSRRAMALILAVGVLVLLAIIGVAFLASTGTDGYGSKQHVSNTEMDLMSDGVVQMVAVQLRDGKFDTTQSPHRFLPSGAPGLHSATCGDSNESLCDQLLSPRLPELSSSGVPQWAAITAALAIG